MNTKFNKFALETYSKLFKFLVLSFIILTTDEYHYYIHYHYYHKTSLLHLLEAKTKFNTTNTNFISYLRVLYWLKIKLN